MKKSILLSSFTPINGLTVISYQTAEEIGNGLQQIGEPTVSTKQDQTLLSPQSRKGRKEDQSNLDPRGRGDDVEEVTFSLVTRHSPRPVRHSRPRSGIHFVTSELKIAATAITGTYN